MSMFQVLMKSVVRTLNKRCLSISSSHKGILYSKSSLITRMDKENNIVWVDLEMSGLDVNKEHILEMACIVTDGNLNIVAESPEIIIHQPDSVLNNMGEWCKNQHGKSGLTEAVRKSNISLEEAESQMISFVKPYILPGASPLAGNSVHADRVFLQKYMPNFLQLLHYRIIDVSSVKELARRWYSKDMIDTMSKTNSSHRALDDIKNSIKELQMYKERIFR